MNILQTNPFLKSNHNKNRKQYNVSWTLFAWRVSRPRMPGHQVPCFTAIHAQRDVEEQ
jgi:hypothetical protein